MPLAKTLPSVVGTINWSGNIAETVAYHMKRMLINNEVL